MVTALYLYCSFLSSVTSESTYYKSAFTHSHAYKYTSGRGVPWGDTCSVGTHSCTSEAAMFGSVSCGLMQGSQIKTKTVLSKALYMPHLYGLGPPMENTVVNQVIVFLRFSFFYVSCQKSIPAKTKWWPQSEELQIPMMVMISWTFGLSGTFHISVVLMATLSWTKRLSALHFYGFKWKLASAYFKAVLLWVLPGQR